MSAAIATPNPTPTTFSTAGVSITPAISTTSNSSTKPNLLPLQQNKIISPNQSPNTDDDLKTNSNSKLKPSLVPLPKIDSQISTKKKNTSNSATSLSPEKMNVKLTHVEPIKSLDTNKKKEIIHPPPSDSAALPLNAHSNKVLSPITVVTTQDKIISVLEPPALAKVPHNHNHNPNLAKVTPLGEIALSKAPPESEKPSKPHVRILSPLDVPPHEVPASEQNGKVTLLYELYKEKFSIKAGTITKANIDDVYGFSDVMPNCRLRLSSLSPSQVREKIIEVTEKPQTSANIFLPEKSDGTYCDLRNDHSYYVYVEQDSAELEREKAERDKRVTTDTSCCSEVRRDDGRGFDSCTCIYGAPCVDEYGCKDWSKRFEVAFANGWAGFQAKE